jgi:hypothetical protein
LAQADPHADVAQCARVEALVGGAVAVIVLTVAALIDGLALRPEALGDAGLGATYPPTDLAKPDAGVTSAAQPKRLVDGAVTVVVLAIAARILAEAGRSVTDDGVILADRGPLDGADPTPAHAGLTEA